MQIHVTLHDPAYNQLPSKPAFLSICNIRLMTSLEYLPLTDYDEQ